MIYLESDQRAFQLYMKGLSYRQVGDVMGISRQRAFQKIDRYKEKMIWWRTTQLACWLGIQPNEAHQLRYFFSHTDLFTDTNNL